MNPDFAELDFRKTPLGDLSLRRRRVQALDNVEVFEVKLGDAFLMSSLFHEVEVALADLGLAALDPGDRGMLPVVGGLGLGYTAIAALKHPAVRELIVVDALEAVIDWHQRGLVPLGPTLTGDPRSPPGAGRFFRLVAASAGGFDPTFVPAGASTPFSWTSIIGSRIISCTRAMALSIPWTACTPLRRN